MSGIITVAENSDKTCLRKTSKVATIHGMTNEEQNRVSETEQVADSAEWSAGDAPETQAIENDPSASVESDSLPGNVTDGLDLEAALAAVSTLSDVVAEQEAEEQARLVQAEAEAEAQAEAQARVESPELFFPVPPLATLKRGQLASVVPALVLMGVGAWLTFSLTIQRELPDTGLLLAVAASGIVLILLARWLSSGRWARGTLLFALIVVFSGAVLAFLFLQPGLGVGKGWPLIVTATGIAVCVSAFLSQPVERQLVMPGLILIVAGLAGLVITLGLLNGTALTLVASLWPVAVAVVVILWLIPVIFRQRR
jgi:hypothetical protein